MKFAAASFLAVVLGFASVTWWALESSEVAVLETRRSDGEARLTHVWFVERDGEFWLEAATPGRRWLGDLEDSSVVVFTVGARSGRYRALPTATPSVRLRLRALLRQKYGFRDWWVGLLQDTSNSVAVRLRPIESG